MYANSGTQIDLNGPEPPPVLEGGGRAAFRFLLSDYSLAVLYKLVRRHWICSKEN